MKQNIHTAVHLHTLESVTVNFSAMCTDHQEETEGAICKFWVCMAISLSSLSIYPVYLSNTLKWGQPFFLNSFRAQRVILLERKNFFTSSTSDTPGLCKSSPGVVGEASTTTMTTTTLEKRISF